MVESAVGLLALLSLVAAGPLQRFPRESEDYQNTDFSAYANFTANEVCFSDNEVFQKGDLMPNPGPCEECRCEPPSIVCNMVKCPVNTNGCRTIQRPNQCCPDYNCECDYNGQLYNDGERLDLPEEPCKVCYCKGGDVMCTSIQCYKRDDCEPRQVPGQCCPKYENCPIRDGNGTNTEKNGSLNKSLNHSLKKEMQPWLLTKSVPHASSSPSLKETDTSSSTTEKENIILLEHKKTVEYGKVYDHGDSKFDHTDRPNTITDVEGPTTTLQEKDITSNLEESILIKKSETVAPVDEVIFTRIDMLRGNQEGVQSTSTLTPPDIIEDGYTTVAQRIGNINEKEASTTRATTVADEKSTPSIQTQGYTSHSHFSTMIIAEKDSSSYPSNIDKEKESEGIKDSPMYLFTNYESKQEPSTIKDELKPNIAVETPGDKILPQDSLFVMSEVTEKPLTNSITESRFIKNGNLHKIIDKENGENSKSHSGTTTDIGSESKEKIVFQQDMRDFLGNESTDLRSKQELTTKSNNLQSDKITNITEEPKTSVKSMTQNIHVENLPQSSIDKENTSPLKESLNSIREDVQDSNFNSTPYRIQTTPTGEIDTTPYLTEDNVNVDNIQLDTVICTSEKCHINGVQNGLLSGGITEGLETTTESGLEFTNEISFTKLNNQDIPSIEIDDKIKVSDNFKQCNNSQCNNSAKRSSLYDELLSTMTSATTRNDPQVSESLKNSLNEINTNRGDALNVDTTLYLTDLTEATILKNNFQKDPNSRNSDLNSLEDDNRYSIEEVTNTPNQKETIFISENSEHHDNEETSTLDSLVENVKYDSEDFKSQSILKNIDDKYEKEQVAMGVVINNVASTQRKDLISDAPPILDLNSHVPFLQLGGHSIPDDFSDVQEDFQPTASTGVENKNRTNELILNPVTATLNRINAEKDYTTVLFTTVPPQSQEELGTNNRLYKDELESKDSTKNTEVGSTVSTSHIPLTPGDLKMLAEYLINEKIQPVKTNDSKYIPNPWLQGNLTSEENIASILTAANVSIGVMNFTNRGTVTPEIATNTNDLIKVDAFGKEVLFKGNNDLEKGNTNLNKTVSLHIKLNEDDNLAKKYIKPQSLLHSGYSSEELTTDSTLYEITTLETVTDMSSEVREKAVLLSSVTGEDLEKFTKDILKANISSEMVHKKYNEQTLISGTSKDNNDKEVVKTEEVSVTSQIVPMEKYHQDINNNEPAGVSEVEKTKAEEYSPRKEQNLDSIRKMTIHEVLEDTTLKDNSQTPAVFP